MKKLSICLMVAVLLLLLACSDSSNKLRIGIIKPSIDHLPLSYGLEKKLIDGNNLSLVPFTSGWEVQEALIGGSIDLAIMPFSYVWTAVEKGYPVKTVAFFERETDAIIANPQLSSIAALNGKKIALLKGSSLDLLWRDFAARNAIEATPVYFSSPNEAVAALQSDDVDAAVLYVPLVNKLAGQFPVLHWFGKDYPTHPCCNLVANTSQITPAKERMLRKLYTSLHDVLPQINGNSPELRSYAKAAYGISDAELTAALAHTHFSLGLEQEGREFELKMAAVSRQAGYLDKLPKTEDVYWNLHVAKKPAAD